MKNILFPTDFTTSTEQALDWALFFAQKFGATLTLLHVYQPPVPDTTLPTMGDLGVGMAASADLEEIGRERLDQLVSQLRAQGVTVESDWRIGGVENEILEAAKERNVDLIITGRSELNTFFDRLAGSAASDVAIDAKCPVLVIPSSHEQTTATPVNLDSIVYATQLEFDDHENMQRAVELANQFGAAIRLLKVKASNQPDIRDDQQFLTNLQRAYGDKPLPVDSIDSRTVTGGMEDYLHTHKADLLIMTTRERGFLDGLLNPSLTHRMVNRSSIPVLVYHAQTTNFND